MSETRLVCTKCGSSARSAPAHRAVTMIDIATKVFANIRNLLYKPVGYCCFAASSRLRPSYSDWQEARAQLCLAVEAHAMRDLRDRGGRTCLANVCFLA